MRTGFYMRVYTLNVTCLFSHFLIIFIYPLLIRSVVERYLLENISFNKMNLLQSTNRDMLMIDDSFRQIYLIENIIKLSSSAHAEHFANTVAPSK